MSHKLETKQKFAELVTANLLNYDEIVEEADKKLKGLKRDRFIARKLGEPDQEDEEEE